MAFIKKWGPKKKSKEKQKDYTTERIDDEDINLPPFERGRKDQRNLSISRSGRHKLKSKQRATVEEVFGGEHASYGDRHNMQAAPTQGSLTRDYSKPTTSRPAVNMAPSTQSPGTANYNCRESEATAQKLSGSQRMASTPTAV